MALLSPPRLHDPYRSSPYSTKNGSNQPNQPPIGYVLGKDGLGWINRGVRFYTGVPSARTTPMWHGYWTRRLTAMRRAGIAVTTRPLRYRVESIRLPDGSVHELLVQREKGIDLRLGLDVVRMARNAEMDVAVLFSQDQDLAEVALEVRDIARSTNRWLKIVSAFPYGPNATASRGVDRTDWFRMTREFYDSCLDPRDYRPAG